VLWDQSTIVSFEASVSRDNGDLTGFCVPADLFAGGVLLGFDDSGAMSTHSEGMASRSFCFRSFPWISGARITLMFGVDIVCIRTSAERSP